MLSKRPVVPKRGTVHNLCNHPRPLIAVPAEACDDVVQMVCRDCGLASYSLHGLDCRCVECLPDIW